MLNGLSKEDIKKDFDLKKQVIEQIKRGFLKIVSEVKRGAKIKSKKQIYGKISRKS